LKPVVDSEANIKTADAAPATDHEAPVRPPCPAPANFGREVKIYDENAQVIHWDGPRYRMTARILGEGPPLFLIPGIASTYRGYCLTLRKLSERFRTIIYDYPGEHPDDRAKLSKIKHDHLVDDLFGLIDHLNLGRVFLFGMSFGSTITLKALHREPRRFPRAAVQGGFAHRSFTVAEKIALGFGRMMPGPASRLPFHEKVLEMNNRMHFPYVIENRWPFYVEQNGLTPIAALAHRLDMLSKLDLRPILPEIPTELLLIQGNEDRIVPRRYHEELKAALPKGDSTIVPIMGHQPHYTHAELLAQLVGGYLLPCAPGGCPNEAKEQAPEQADGGAR
jgi:pimeloyl-ACP methyl ester carboxylesterase